MTKRQHAVIKFTLEYVLANIDHAGEFASNRKEIGCMSEHELEQAIATILRNLKLKDM
jgi:hypothetical protein